MMDEKELKEKLRKILPELLAEGLGDGTYYLTNDKLHISADTPMAELDGTETNGADLAVRENGGVMEIYNVASGNTVMTIESHQARHQPGGADEMSALQTVKRNASGAVVFTGVGSVSTATTGTATVKTTNVGPVSFTRAILKNNGNGTAKILRNGSTLTSTTGAATVTVTNSNLGLTGTNTWTLSAVQTTATITATATISKDSRQTVNVR